MAKVKKRVDEKVTYKLKISQEEMDVLCALLGGLTGTGTVRETSSGIYNKIQEFGRYFSYQLFKDQAETKGDFNFHG